MYWTCGLRKDYPLVICFIPSSPILCPDMYLHIHGTTAVCLVMLSCLSCQKECTNIQALSESPLEVCIRSINYQVDVLVHLVPDSTASEFWWSASSNTTKTGGWRGYHVPGSTRLVKYRNPFCPPDFVSGDHARGTRVLNMSAKMIHPLVIRFILSCPILCPDMYLHIHGSTAVCLFAMLSCLSCQKECTNIQALSESPLEVCILTRRVGTPCSWFHCFWVLVEGEL